MIHQLGFAVTAKYVVASSTAVSRSKIEESDWLSKVGDIPGLAEGTLR